MSRCPRESWYAGGVFAAFLLRSLAAAALSVVAFAADNVPAHGLWVWKSPSVLETPQGAEKLWDFCQSQGINEVYVSVSGSGDAAGELRLAHLIDLLHRSNIQVEALLSSSDADRPGPHREKLLAQVGSVIQFNKNHPAGRFDGIHLDIEPQQRAENKGPENLVFLPGLVDAYSAIRIQADAAHLTVNADIQKKLLHGSLAQRKMLLSSLPRLTLMLYEESSPSDGESLAQKTQRLRASSQSYLDIAYADLGDPNLATIVIALRTPDYVGLLPQMLKLLDDANHGNPRYRGWARHSYNDSLPGAH